MENNYPVEGPDVELAASWITLGNNVKRFRTSRGWTQAELGERLASLGVRMHQTTIAKLEGGTRPTVTHELWALASVLEVGYATLLQPPKRDQTEDRAVEEAKRRVTHAEAVFRAAAERVARATSELHAARTAVLEARKSLAELHGGSADDGVDQEED